MGLETTSMSLTTNNNTLNKAGLSMNKMNRNHFGENNNNPQGQYENLGAANKHKQNNSDDSNNNDNDDENLN